ncbi:MAG: cysteine desulfurase [Clostridium sp.]
MKNYRNEFPLLNREINGNRIVYLDSGATTQRPSSVIDGIVDYYKNSNSNPHRGAYSISIEATEAFENARKKVKDFINAPHLEEVIFTKSTTESINLVAYSYGMNFIEAGDEIVVLISEHHSNLIPWQRVCKAKGATLKFVYLKDDLTLSLEDFKNTLSNNTKLVTFAAISNVLGNVYPIKEMIELSHEVGAFTLVDGAQAVGHMKIDVKDLNCDFLAFSAHKMYGPMGIGVLYGKKDLLNKMPPFLFGGDMVEYVYEEDTTFAELPHKFEGGTQNVEGAVGISKAIDFINSIGFEEIKEREHELISYGLQELIKLPYVSILGTLDAYKRSGVISFTVDGIHPHDMASILDSKGVCVRAGNHCAQPLMRYLGINSTLRASFSILNEKEDIDVMIEGIKEGRRIFGYGHE